jgi:N6-L-threonylcarbamoyladenine synthase
MRYRGAALPLFLLVYFIQMRVLGIESSCDETAASVVEDGRRLLSNVVNSQIDIHKAYGGVVPEVAARSHLEVINPVVDKALADADCTWDDIDAIAVTYAPGLIGSLLIGTLAARTLALLHDKPLYPIHHVEAHVYANFIVEQQLVRGEADGSDPISILPAAPAAVFGAETSALPLPLPTNQPKFPMLALIVSGGHSQLVLFKDHGNYELLGQTQDDAVGEAFDKVAKIIGLPYPGGPSIANAALAGNPNAYYLPKAKLSGKYDYSFSGLKTAVLRRVQKECNVAYDYPSTGLSGLLTPSQRNDFAASFKKTAVETLVDNVKAAFSDYGPASVVIAGGVAANTLLRQELTRRIPLPLEYAPMQLCTDNAAMIATLGYYYAKKNASTDPRELSVVPSLSMRTTAWATQ